MPEKTATVKIAGEDFECYPLDEAGFINAAGVYVILCVGEDGASAVLDVGQTDELGKRLDGVTTSRSCWERNCATGRLWVGVHPADSKLNRAKLAKQIQDEFMPICVNCS